MIPTEFDMAVTAFDIHHPETVVGDLEEASRQLRASDTVPDSILGLLSDLCQDIGNTDLDRASDIAPAAWMGVQSAALRALAAVHDSDGRAQRRRLRLLIEELRFRLARLADDQPIADGRPVKDVVRWLDQAWNVPQGVKGELFGVSDRTWQRWASANETSEPTGDDDRQVRLVARLVNDLRFLLTANGVLDWLRAEHPDLGDRTPLQVVRDADIEGLQGLLSVVRRARTGAGA
jgi:uncharacterized protein (DUF2384 family)